MTTVIEALKDTTKDVRVRSGRRVLFCTNDGDFCVVEKLPHEKHRTIIYNGESESEAVEALLRGE